MKKIATVFLCTCCGELERAIDFSAIQRSIENEVWKSWDGTYEGVQCLIVPRLCDSGVVRQFLADGEVKFNGPIVVGACSYLARGAEVSRAFGDITINRWVDIREGCAFIHGSNKEKATKKSRVLVAIGLEAAKYLPLERISSPQPHKKIVVVGGGPAGLTAAASCAYAGIETVLIEKTGAVGGMLKVLGKLFPDNSSAKELLEDLRHDADSEKLTCLLSSSIEAIALDDTGYQITVAQKGKEPQRIQAGAIIMATGAIPVLPKGLYEYGESKLVSSQMEMEVLLNKIESGTLAGDALPKEIVFLQCVAARDAENPYCSAVCCPTALKNGLRIRALSDDITISILHRNIVTPGIHLEAFYRQARRSGILFKNYEEGSVPVVRTQGGMLTIDYVEALTGSQHSLNAGLLVCSTPLRSSPGSKELARLSGIRLDDMGFMCGKDPVAPVETHQSGIFVCGSARWPVTVVQAMDQGKAAAMQALGFLHEGQSGGWSGHEGYIARPVDGKCSGCGRCVLACPHRACSMQENTGVVQISSLRCQACGVCAAVCPNGAVSHTIENIYSLRAQIKRIFKGGDVWNS